MKHKKKEEVLEGILERLDLIINLLCFQVTSERSITEGARILKMAGLDNRTIANVLNTTDGTVRTLTANLRARVGGRR